MLNQLSPTQQQAYDRIVKILPLGNIFALVGQSGAGKSTILRSLHEVKGGVILQMKDLLQRTQQRHPFAIEEAFLDLMLDALNTAELVIFDDLDLLSNVIGYNGRNYPRSGLFCGPIITCINYAIEVGKKIVIGTSSVYSSPVLTQRALQINIGNFTVSDYQFFGQQYLEGSIAACLDYQKIYRFASRLNAHQLKNICVILSQQENLDTDGFIDYLREQHLISNVNLGEVQAIDLYELKGIDEVLESLEAHLILPLVNYELATELQLKPKRGVLLAGAPGTGKTTIGRALAHRLKSKFFLIDGTFISGSGSFYNAVNRVFQAAKQNAPAIIFIDDSDVIFENGEELGLYRYLLTMLDGLESQSVGQVCVMMTAMEVGSLPPALVRSGRIELWLELSLPDAAARSAILESFLTKLPPALQNTDKNALVKATVEFTGADLKRLIEDGKNLYAYDRARQIDLKSPTEYFLKAVENVRANKQLYARAEAKSIQQKQNFSSGGAAGGVLF